MHSEIHNLNRISFVASRQVEKPHTEILLGETPWSKFAEYVFIHLAITMGKIRDVKVNTMGKNTDMICEYIG